jgi:hypothetical protein
MPRPGSRRRRLQGHGPGSESFQREAPRDKRVVSETTQTACGSCQREAPRDKRVASLGPLNLSATELL